MQDKHTYKEKPPQSEIVHHGVKGMKWGKYTTKDLVSSKQQVKKAAITSGKAVSKAALGTAKVAGKTIAYVAHHKRMTAGALIAASLLRDAVSHGILSRAVANREATFAAGKLAARAIGSTAAKINYAKLVKGAYKITTM